jgi:Xaa-Pro dipeptidase
VPIDCGTPCSIEKALNVMFCTPETELLARTKKVQQAMLELQLDALLLAQSADLFYFTGTIQSGALFIPADGEPCYFVRKDVGRARKESALARIVPMSSPRDLPGHLSSLGYAMPRRLGFEHDVLPVAVFERYRKVFSSAECVDASSLIRRVRMIKSPYEVELIRKAAAQADAVFRHAREVLREGMTDIELAAELEHFARLQGHPGLIRMRSFNGEMLFAHVFSGPDAACPAYLDTPLGGVGPHASFGQGASWRRIQANEPVVIDTGSFVEGYLADQTRMLSIGELPEHLARAYDDMLRVQSLMEGLVKPGIAWAKVYNVCCALASDLGYVDHFMGAKGAQANFIGHGLGIEIDELPVIAPAFTKDVFEPLMTFAFEPKAVFPGEGAVGIENTYVLHPHGIEKLTISTEALSPVY